MHVIDLRFPAGMGIASRPAVGPGSPFPDPRFSAWVCRVGSREPVTFEPPSAGTETVLYVAAGIGAVQQAAAATVLAPRKVLRLYSSACMTLQRQGQAPMDLVCLSSEREPTTRQPQEVHLDAMEGMRFPARRWGRSITNGASPVKTAGFTSGLSILETRGGQVPWHNHPDRQHELYLLLSGGSVQMCVGDEVAAVHPPAAVWIPGDQWHQVTNLDARQPLELIYCYEGEQAAPHWWQERDGVLPRAGQDSSPPLPAGAFPQCTATDPEEWRRIAAARF